MSNTSQYNILTKPTFVVDSSVLIDLVYSGFCKEALRNDYFRLEISDYVFNNELIAKHKDLPNLGLQIVKHRLEKIIPSANELVQENNGLTLFDAFGILHAKNSNLILLTNDKLMRSVAKEYVRDVHGTILLIEGLYKVGLIQQMQIENACKIFSKNNRFLPIDHIKRIPTHSKNKRRDKSWFTKYYQVPA